MCHKEIDQCANCPLNAPLKAVPPVEEKLQWIQIPAFYIRELCSLGHQCLGFVNCLAHFGRWMKPFDLLIAKTYMFNLLPPPLCIEMATVWSKLVISFVWLFAALTLTAGFSSSFWFTECSNQLWFPVPPFTSRKRWLYNPWLCVLCAEIRNIVFASVVRHTVFSCLYSWLIDCVKNYKNKQLVDSYRFVFSSFSRKIYFAHRFDVFGDWLFLFFVFFFVFLFSSLKAWNHSCVKTILDSQFLNIIRSGQTSS